ncbi:hypothetical protein [Nocardia sp. NPDC024068]|uniref:hypothetical protein n=1 Tax=Nocardia sp. NPDC024068 TaxID=3157197 RepID=UPI0033E97896
MSEDEADIELRALLGMRGRAGWVFLAGLVATITLYMVPPFHDVPAAQAAVAFAGMLGAAAILLLVPGDPLPWPATAVVLAVGPGAVVLTHLNFTDDALRQPWAAFAASYVLGVLALRGRIGAAWTGAAAVTATLAVVDIVLGIALGSVFVSIIALSTLVGASVCALILRPTQRSLRLLHDEAAMRAAAEATMDAEHAERVRQLARLDKVARPMLERIARGVELAPAEREECRLLEAELRDGLRAPQLVTDQLNSAARGARSRGVEVLLLDDGGFADATAAVRAEVVRLAARELDAANAGAVTVRVLPPGRRHIATVLASAPGGDRRIEIATTGEVLVSA